MIRFLCKTTYEHWLFNNEHRRFCCGSGQFYLYQWNYTINIIISIVLSHWKNQLFKRDFLDNWRKLIREDIDNLYYVPRMFVLYVREPRIFFLERPLYFCFIFLFLIISPDNLVVPNPPEHMFWRVLAVGLPWEWYSVLYRSTKDQTPSQWILNVSRFMVETCTSFTEYSTSFL